MFKTIGIFAHVDGGKTTFSEQLLYKNGSIRNLGRVDNQTAFLDCDNIEKERGITVFAEQASFDYNENKYYIIDTPGHTDFSPEAERTMSALDYAILSMVVMAYRHIQLLFLGFWKIMVCLFSYL